MPSWLVVWFAVIVVRTSNGVPGPCSAFKSSHHFASTIPVEVGS